MSNLFRSLSLSLSLFLPLSLSLSLTHIHTHTHTHTYSQLLLVIATWIFKTLFDTLGAHKEENTFKAVFDKAGDMYEV
jgi:hypothetical protein